MNYVTLNSMGRKEVNIYLKELMVVSFMFDAYLPILEEYIWHIHVPLVVKILAIL